MLCPKHKPGKSIFYVPDRESQRVCMYDKRMYSNTKVMFNIVIFSLSVSCHFTYLLFSHIIFNTDILL